VSSFPPISPLSTGISSPELSIPFRGGQVRAKEFLDLVDPAPGQAAQPGTGRWEPVPHQSGPGGV